MAAGILVLALDLGDAPAPDSSAWFASERVPDIGNGARLLSCERWTDCVNPKRAVLTYEFDQLGSGEPGAPASGRAAGLELAMAGCCTVLHFEGELIAPAAGPMPQRARGLLINAMSVDPDVEVDFNTWYDQEHLPALSAVPGALCARRFRSRAGSPRYLAIYHLDSPAVQASPQWKRAANTPWTERMRPHFLDHVRIVAEAAR